MGNLIRAQLFRLRARPAGVAAAAGFLVFNVCMLLLESAPARGGVKEFLDLIASVSAVGLFFALYCTSLACSGVNKFGLLKNEAVFGVPRYQMYLSRLATAILLGLFLLLVLLGSTLLPAFCLFSDRAALPACLPNLLTTFAAAFPLWCASAGLMLCLRMACTSDTATTLAAVLFYLLGWPVIGMAVANFYPQTAGLAPSLFHALYFLHPATPFWNGAMLPDSMPTGFTATIDPLQPEATLAALPYCWGLGLGWLAATSLVGIWCLHRRDLT